MIIQHNIEAMNANRQIGINVRNQKKSTEKLSSGYRINRAADNAAGLTISEKMRWQVRGLDTGAKNTEDGTSFLNVADGALSEVENMLHRMKELSIQAANDTNTKADRLAIQKEIDGLISEIDRIGEETEFNTKKIFKGGETTLVDDDGNPIAIKDIPMENFDLSKSTLLPGVFSGFSNGRELSLSVATGSKSNSTVGTTTSATWGLIYGNGSTSHSNFRVTYEDSSGNKIVKNKKLEQMTLSNYSYDDTTKTYNRTFSYNAGDDVKFDIVQSVQIGAKSGGSQYYNMNYEIKNTGTKDADIEFLFNSDSAYNNNDSCESYYIDGQKVDKFVVYAGDNSTYATDSNIKPYSGSSLASQKSFSIIDADDALPFSVNIKWSEDPDTVAIGSWPSGTGEWSYYNNIGSHTGYSTSSNDLAFSLIWNKSLSASGQTGDSKSISFQYGITSAKTDSNLSGVDIKYHKGSKVHVNELDLWIQSGAKETNGLFIAVKEMNSSILGLRGMNVVSNYTAGEAITMADNALASITKQHTDIGAQVNRLEYIKSIDNSTSENTQAAESRIRDTDIADEMIKYSKNNILMQAGQSMIAQANQSSQGVISLLQ